MSEVLGTKNAFVNHVDSILGFIFPEPGYYEDGKFGIRIESLVVVKKTETKVCYINIFSSHIFILKVLNLT